MKLLKLLPMLTCLSLSACDSDRQADAHNNGVNTTIQADSSKNLSVHGLLKNAVSAYLGIEANIVVENRNRQDGWIFVCGKPVQMDGSAMNYSRTSIAKRAADGLVDDYFCALVLHTDDNAVVRELVVGDTDAAVLDWADRHGFPESLLYHQ